MTNLNAVNTCPIWGSYPACGHFADNRKVFVTQSRRVGVRYAITREAELRIGDGVDESCKARLTTMLIDQHERGVEWPEVTASLIDRAINKPPLAAYERADRLLRYIGKQAGELGTKTNITRDTLEARAWSESTKWDELFYLIKYLEQMNWIQIYGGAGAALTVDGHSRIAVQRINTDSSQAFVAMWFDDAMTSAYNDGFEPAIRDAGYQPFMINQKEHVNKIEDEIIAEIRRSRFLVADFTHDDDGARGSVYYEAGFAEGLRLPIFFTCREDYMKELHFDISHFNCIVWSTPAELREKLKNRILHILGPGPGVDTSP